MSNEKKLKPLLTESSQAERNKNLLAKSRLLSPEITSEIIPFHIDINGSSSLTNDELNSLELLQIDAARIATASLASLSTINELDHLGGGLDLIPALMLSLALTDYRTTEYTIEHAHTSIGYYSALSALGFLPKKEVIDGFRRGIEIPGHVSWVPGGTQLNGGRLGVMVPVAVGQALAKRATMGEQAWVLVHCGDAGWISGQALNGFNGADLHHAPVTFIMHRNGIQLSGSTKKIMDKDPRKIIESLGIDIIETPSLFDMKSLFNAYREAKQKAINGRPSLIYPTGYRSSNKDPVTLDKFGNIFGIEKETSDFARQHNVSMGTEIWIPGSLMSFRDLRPMLECLFLVNNLPGGVGHHDGHMKGRNLDEVLSNPMMELTTSQLAQLDKLNQKPKQKVVTKSRPESGSKNFEITQRMLDEVALPMLGKNVSARAGIEAGYEMIAKKYPQNMFVVSCDLDVSTKLLKACQHLDPKHRFEMSIEEQASALIANGLALNNTIPQLTVFSTFAAFFEGIAREGFELWRYTRNLNGVNEGLNVTFHMSHVGSCTGRDHFSGWSLDWITLAMGYLPIFTVFMPPQMLDLHLSLSVILPNIMVGILSVSPVIIFQFSKTRWLRSDVGCRFQVGGHGIIP